MIITKLCEDELENNLVTFLVLTTCIQRSVEKKYGNCVCVCVVCTKPLFAVDKVKTVNLFILFDDDEKREGTH